MQELILFSSTFIIVFLLGLQSINVNNRRYVASAITSIGIGSCTLLQLRLVPKMEMNLLQDFCYLAGGPLGIMFSIWFYKEVMNRDKVASKGSEKL